MRVRIACLLLFAALFSGCADTGNDYKAYLEGFHEGMVAQWGPENTWTPAQRQAYATQIYKISDMVSAQRKAQIASVYSSVYVPQSTGYNPYIASGGVSPAQMLHAPQTTTAAPVGALGVNRYDPNSLANPCGAGSPYKANGLMNPYSQYGSPYSNKSWRNPYATDPPKLYDSRGNYYGKLSTNRYDPDSTSNPSGRYGSKYSPDSINNPYGAGNPYSTQPIYVRP